MSINFRLPTPDDTQHGRRLQHHLLVTFSALSTRPRRAAHLISTCQRAKAPSNTDRNNLHRRFTLLGLSHLHIFRCGKRFGLCCAGRSFSMFPVQRIRFLLSRQLEVSSQSDIATACAGSRDVAARRRDEYLLPDRPFVSVNSNDQSDLSR